MKRENHLKRFYKARDKGIITLFLISKIPFPLISSKRQLIVRAVSYGIEDIIYESLLKKDSNDKLRYREITSLNSNSEHATLLRDSVKEYFDDTCMYDLDNYGPNATAFIMSKIGNKL